MRRPGGPRRFRRRCRAARGPRHRRPAGGTRTVRRGAVDRSAGRDRGRTPRRRRDRAARIARRSRSGTLAGGCARPPPPGGSHHGDTGRRVRRPRRRPRTPPDPRRRAVRRHAATGRARHRTVPRRTGGGRLPGRRRGCGVGTRRRRGRGAATRRPHDGSRRSAPHRRWRCRPRLRVTLRPAPTVRRGDRRCDGGDPRDHRSRLGQPRPSDRHHRCRRRPDAVRVVRRERRGPAHERARRPGPHRQRQHRAALPDDGDVGPGDRERRQRDPRPSAGADGPPRHAPAVHQPAGVP